MASLNKVLLIGNLGRDPEVRTTPQGVPVANFSIACTETWSDPNGQRQERTEWVDLVLWRKQAEIAQKYLRKGSRIFVEGKLQTRSWDDQQSGQKRYRTEVVVDRMMMLDGRPAEGGGAGGGEDYAWARPAPAGGGRGGYGGWSSNWGPGG